MDSAPGVGSEGSVLRMVPLPWSLAEVVTSDVVSLETGPVGAGTDLEVYFPDIPRSLQRKPCMI